MSLDIADATLVFDLDGTLVDTAPDLIGAAHHALSTRGLAPIAGNLLKPWISYGARRILVEALAIADHHASDAEIDEMLTQFLVHYEANIAVESRPFPGIVDALAHFRERGCKLAVCTNKREGLSLALLDALDMIKLFDAIAGRDTFPVCKPDPRHLSGVVQMAGGEMASCIMVGDSNVDIDTAKAAGVPSIGVTFGYSQIPIADTNPSVVLDDYTNLVRTIENLHIATRAASN